MIFPITSLYAIPLAVIFLALWIGVTKTRSALSVSIGDAGNADLHERIRRHGNFVEWVPMILILMVLAEGQGAGPLWLHAAGALVVIGRILHPIGLRADAPTHPLRIAGNSACILATLTLTVALALVALGSRP
ncbi:MAPEG family protein [Bosea sp. 2KB_26]|uniref:MAPEG family protein n=1 Tax=Bosea sp. 2KB_26 TaxID=3237475 RepID=UPI003F92D0FA